MVSGLDLADLDNDDLGSVVLTKVLAALDAWLHKHAERALPLWRPVCDRYDARVLGMSVRELRDYDRYALADPETRAFYRAVRERKPG